ncbi:hypothetical protein D1871_11525 [Nakamurella silvestris]|nr:hypothetical protein D1871_11525 [Nakamurella silvestris]
MRLFQWGGPALFVFGILLLGRQSGDSAFERLWPGILVITISLVMGVVLMAFYLWRRESRYQTQAILNGMADLAESEGQGAAALDRYLESDLDDYR